MTIENTAGDRVAVIPNTGEVLDLPAASPVELAAALDTYSTLRERLEEFRAAVIAEVAHRADALGRRKLRYPGVEFEVNPPTEDVYDVDVLRAELGKLADAGLIARELIDELIVQPRPPAPRVDRRRIATLARSDDRRILAALAAARQRVPTRRTVKVLTRAVEGTIAEEAGA